MVNLEPSPTYVLVVIRKESQMEEPNYQKPPLREEIEAFFKQLKGVIFTIIGFGILIAIVFRLHMFSKTDMAHQIGAYINKHFPTFMFTMMIDLLSYTILCRALYDTHLIYKRYRLGYFSQMMWCFIGFFTLQLGNIPIALYMDGLIPIIIIALLAIGLTALLLSYYKKNRPPLAKPLTKEQNERRKDIINALVNSYKVGTGPIATDAKAFAKARYLMDIYPESLETLNNIPSVFYSRTLEDPTKNPSVHPNDPLYNLYYDHAYHLIQRDQNPDLAYTLDKKDLFD